MTERGARQLATRLGTLFAVALLSGGVGCGLVAGRQAELAREGCAFEARFRPASERAEEHRRRCLERIEAPGAAWRAGSGSSERDPELCLALAHAGVERYRACMRAGGWRELSAGRVPYAQDGATPREAAIESRRCAERSFEGSRYGPFTTEFESCLERRGWQALTR